MKLLFCKSCFDLFSLSGELKSCGCGKSSGNYLSDGLNAVPIGFSNPSFIAAIETQPKQGQGKDFTAFIIPENCKTFKKRL